MRVKVFPKTIEVDCPECKCILELVPSDIRKRPNAYEGELYVLCCLCEGVISVSLPSDWKAELCL